MPGKSLPIVVAAFASEDELWRAVALVEEHKIGRDFIGVFIGESGGQVMYLVSVFVPSRLHKEVGEVFQTCAAMKVGFGDEARIIWGRHVPHPGVMEDHDMKFPMGDDYPANRNRRPATSMT